MTPRRYLAVALLSSWPLLASADEPSRLPGTAPLTGQEDLADKMMEGLHGYAERQIARSAQTRPRYWQRDPSSPAAYERSVRPNRERFRKVLGVVDPRLPVRLERFGDDDNPARVAEAGRYRAYQVRWPVLHGNNCQRP
jgi:hypothetical protein